MKRFIKAVILTACTCSLCAHPVQIYAASNPSIGPGQAVSLQTACPTTEEAKQAIDILSDLYANETNKTMQTLAIDISLAAICGTNENNGTVHTTTGETLGIIGKYPKDPSYFSRMIYSALNDNPAYCISGDQMLVLQRDQPSHDLSSLSLFYENAKQIKAATAGLDETGKAKYIHDLICAKLSYEVTEHPHLPVEAWISGKGTCYGYAGLFYLFGTYCGLHVEPVVGMTQLGYHAWDIVTVNGVRKLIDVTWDDTAETTDYFLLDEHALDAQRTAYTGDFDTMRALCTTHKDPAIPKNY